MWFRIPLGWVSVEVVLERPTGSRPTTCWRDYSFHLGWECFRNFQEAPEEVSGDDCLAYPVSTVACAPTSNEKRMDG